MSESLNIFNPLGAVENPRSVNTDLYKVSFKDGKNGIYTAKVRFVPWVNNPARCIVDKQVCWVKDPVSNRAMYVDDPRSIGEYSPVTDMFFKLYNTKVGMFIDYAKKNLSSKLQYASLVQIIEDEQHPELVGQIKVFIYGKKIWQKIYDQEHLPNVPPVNPFHPIDGKVFYIRCVEQSGFNNFDQSMFLDKGNTSSAMYIPTMDGSNWEQVTNSTDQNRVVEYLRMASPDLSKYEYQPWTQEQTNFVNEALQQANIFFNSGTNQTNMSVLKGGGMQGDMQYVPQPSFPGAVMPQPNTATSQPIQSIPPMSQPAIPQNNSSGGFSIGSIPSSGITPGAMPPQPQQGITGVKLPPSMNQPQPQTQQQTGSIGGNLDDILNSI